MVIWTKNIFKKNSQSARNPQTTHRYSYQDWNNPGGSVARKEMSEGWPNPDSAKIVQPIIQAFSYFDKKYFQSLNES
jgi:hypothetical protein